MTRDAEHTPNGYEDAASVVVNQAPAPSSLAGGEVLTDALDAWIVDGLKQADQRLAEIDPAGCSGMTPEDVKSGRVAAYQKGFQNGVKSTLTDASFVIMNAALSPEAPALNAIGCAELEVGRAVYERIEKLIDATTGPEAEELSYLAHLAASVEEVGGYDGPEAPAREAGGVPLDTLADWLVMRERQSTDGTQQHIEKAPAKHFCAGKASAFREVASVLWNSPEWFAALTPRHEAPAEGAGSWMQRLADVQIGRDVDQVYFDFPHREATFLGDLGRALIELRARSSAPEARS